MPTREDIQTLAHQIVRSYEGRIKGLAQLRGTAKAELKDLRRSRMAKGKELRAKLSQGVADAKAAAQARLEAAKTGHAALAETEKRRRAEAGVFRGKLRRAKADGRVAVRARLEGLHGSRCTMSKETRARLTTGHRALAEGVKETRAGLARRHRALAEGVRKQRAQARGFVGSWAAFVSGGKAGVAVRPVRAGVPFLGEEVEISEEEAVARVEVGGMTPEVSALRERVFQYLAGHPDGTRMAELEQEFELARLQMARVLRSLIEESKVEKRGLLYFAI